MDLGLISIDGMDSGLPAFGILRSGQLRVHLIGRLFYGFATSLFFDTTKSVKRMGVTDWELFSWDISTLSQRSYWIFFRD